MRTTTRTRVTAVLAPALIALAALVAACGTEHTASTERADTGPGSGAITVSAAASLTEAFTAIRDEFVATNPAVAVTINVGSSSRLARQILEGAPADVAAFADVAPMASLDERGLLAAPATVFARNRLVIVTAPGNPGDVESLADLATVADVGTVSLCAESAPCGRFAAQALRSAGVTIPETAITRGQDVKATLTAVTRGDADAAVVYATDARAAGSAVTTVPIPQADDVVADYPIAVVAGSGNAPGAQAFVDFVLGPRGRAALDAAGFLAP